MGIFRPARTAVDGPGRANAARPVDLGDPVWHPIEGITLDRYARLTAALARQTFAGAEQAEAWVTTQGIAPDRWRAVQSGWIERMSTNLDVRARYGILYGRS